MKTSLLLLAGLILNTTLLIAEPLLILIRGVNPFILIFLEAILFIGYLVNWFLNDLSKAVQINFGQLEVFVLGYIDLRIIF